MFKRIQEKTYLQLAAVEDNCKGETQDLLELLKLHVPWGEKAQRPAALENTWRQFLQPAFFSNSCTWKLLGEQGSRCSCNAPVGGVEKKQILAVPQTNHTGCAAVLTLTMICLTFCLLKAFGFLVADGRFTFFLLHWVYVLFWGNHCVKCYRSTWARAQCRGECREVICYLFEQRPCLSGPFGSSTLRSE